MPASSKSLPSLEAKLKKADEETEIRRLELGQTPDEPKTDGTSAIEELERAVEPETSYELL
jgi:hypothetical protein